MSSWSGAFDGRARPHGRGTLRLGKRARYEGRIEHGERCGLGTLFVHEGAGSTSSSDDHGSNDEEDGAEGEGSREPFVSALRVVWANDMPNGLGSFVEPDGGRILGRWHEGALCGNVQEEFCDGTLRFAGHYERGLRCGDGIELRQDGGCLVGTWFDGSLHGRFCAYLYPCASDGLALVGEWRHGRMYRAWAATLGGERAERNAITESAGMDRSKWRLPPDACNPALGLVIDAVRQSHAPAPEHGSGAMHGRERPRARALSELLLDLYGRRHPKSVVYRAWGCIDRCDALTTAARHTVDPYEAMRVVVRQSGVGSAAWQATVLDGAAEDAGEGLFARRPLAAGEVVAFFGGVRVGASSHASGHVVDAACNDAPASDDVDKRVGSSTCTGSGSSSSSSSRAAPAEGTIPAGVDADWAMPTLDGWVWVPPSLRSTSCYRASLGHKANCAGWRANCELLPYEHPVLGSVHCLRVRRPTSEAESHASADAPHDAGVMAGCELTVDCSHLVDLPLDRRPAWLVKLLAARTEDGYYAQLRFTPPRTLCSRSSHIKAHGRLRVVAHGPWRVLWFNGVEQGMTFHREDGTLEPLVVGFDYQRVMVAAAAALVSGGRASVCRQQASRRTQVLLVGLGAGSCAAALGVLCCQTADVHVVEIDETVLEAVQAAHGLVLHGARLSLPSGASTIHVTVADAAAHLRSVAAGSQHCVLLDAYDGKGRVPSHLQADDFVAAVCVALAPGGIVVANLWYGTPKARSSADQFVALLKDLCSLQCYALRVTGHEKNRILIAQKVVDCARTPNASAQFLAHLRRQLLEAADAFAAAGTEQDLVRTMQQNALSVQAWN